MEKLIYSHPMGLDKKSVESKKPLAIPRHGKLVPIDFLTYGNIFSQFIEKRWKYPYHSHS